MRNLSANLFVEKLSCGARTSTVSYVLYWATSTSGVSDDAKMLQDKDIAYHLYSHSSCVQLGWAILRVSATAGEM